MIPLDVTVVAVALTRLSEETGASLPVIQWVSTGYTLAVAAGIPTAAWAIGRYGGRRVFLTALTVFTIGSGLAAISWDAPSLIAFRVLQGLGGGFVMPAAMTLTLRSAPKEQRGRMMALLGLPILVGPVFGPPLGGVLTDHLSWRWIFLVNLPIGVAAVLLGRRNLPAARGDRETVLDRRGMLLLPPAMVLLVVGTSNVDDLAARNLGAGPDRRRASAAGRLRPARAAGGRAAAPGPAAGSTPHRGRRPGPGAVRRRLLLHAAAGAALLPGRPGRERHDHGSADDAAGRRRRDQHPGVRPADRPGATDPGDRHRDRPGDLRVRRVRGPARPTGRRTAGWWRRWCSARPVPARACCRR